MAHILWISWEFLINEFTFSTKKISKLFIEHLNVKRNGIQHSLCINKQTSMYRNNSPIFWSCGWLKYFMILSTSPDYSIQHLLGAVSHKFVMVDTLWNVTRWHERLNVMISWNNNARNALFNSPDSKGIQISSNEGQCSFPKGDI